tara:strand:+ start:884 stop:1180 length:297 start_codon:yes stop_codon:yes gene_type:complete
MSAIVNFNLNVKKLPKENFIAGKSGVWVNLTMAINEETRFGNNASVYVTQTKEEREAKKPKNFLGNGQVVWNNGTIVNAEKEAQPESVTQVEADGLPF